MLGYINLRRVLLSRYVFRDKTYLVFPNYQVVNDNSDSFTRNKILFDNDECGRLSNGKIKILITYRISSMKYYHYTNTKVHKPSSCVATTVLCVLYDK